MITIKSHGFKYSRPEANFIFDVSYFANPWRDEKIRNSKSDTKKDEILKFMIEQPGMGTFVNNIVTLIETYNTYYPDEDIRVAICCSAGEYRSPAVVELVAKDLKRKKIDVKIIHNDNSKI